VLKSSIVRAVRCRFIYLFPFLFCCDDLPRTVSERGIYPRMIIPDLRQNVWANLKSTTSTLLYSRYVCCLVEKALGKFHASPVTCLLWWHLQGRYLSKVALQNVPLLWLDPIWMRFWANRWSTCCASWAAIAKCYHAFFKNFASPLFDTL